MGYSQEEALKVMKETETLEQISAGYSRHISLLVEEEMVREMQREIELSKVSKSNRGRVGLMAKHDRERRKHVIQLKRLKDERALALSSRFVQFGLLR